MDVKARQREEERYAPIPDFYRFDSIPEVLERNRNRIQNDIRSIVSQNTAHDQTSTKNAKQEK